MDKVTAAERKLQGLCIGCGIKPPEPAWKNLLLKEWHSYCSDCFWNTCAAEAKERFRIKEDG